MSDETRLALAYLSRVAEPPCPELTALVRRGRAGRGRRTGQGRRRRRRPCPAHRGPSRDRLRSRRSRRARSAGRPTGHAPTTTSGRCCAFTGFARRGPPTAAAGSSAAGAVGRRPGPPRRHGRTRRRNRRNQSMHRLRRARRGGLGRRSRRAGRDGGVGRRIRHRRRRAPRHAAADGFTVAVLAGGIDIPYPAGHAALLHRIGQQGLVVSEYPPGVRPARHRFLTRNRLVAALSGATVVVEAGARSGAANTAAWARALGRAVCAVPGPVTSSASVGCHALLRNGAESRHARRRRRRAHRSHRRTRPGRAARRHCSTVWARPSSGSTRRCPPAVAAPPTRSPSRRACRRRRCSGPLSMLEVCGLVTRDEGYWKLSRQGSHRESARARIVVETG